MEPRYSPKAGTVERIVENPCLVYPSWYCFEGALNVPVGYGTFEAALSLMAETCGKILTAEVSDGTR